MCFLASTAGKFRANLQQISGKFRLKRLPVGAMAA